MSERRSTAAEQVERITEETNSARSSVWNVKAPAGQTGASSGPWERTYGRYGSGRAAITINEPEVISDAAPGSERMHNQGADNEQDHS